MNPEDSREVRADARDVRQDARDVRADVTDTELQDRGVRTDVREDIVTEREASVTGSIRFIKWLLLVLIVISVGNFTRTFVNQDTTDRAIVASHNAEMASKNAEIVSIESRQAALETLSELRGIIARAEERDEEQPDIQAQAIIEALQAIARIEGFICGGPCPERE